jgi:hypothetical protein
MKKITAIGMLVLGLLVILTSCKPPDYGKVAANSDTLRLFLAKYYMTNAYFPDEIGALSSLDPSFAGLGNLWQKWKYSSGNDSYAIWTYPGPTRQSLWFKFNPRSPAETGWFVNDDEGHFKRQPIPLSPQEIMIITKKP